MCHLHRNPTRCASGETQKSSPPAGASGEAAGRRWARFLGAVLVILLFAFVAIPGLQRLGPVREVRETIRRTGIDATALFYTESDVSSEAEASIRDAIRYAHQGGDCSPVTTRDERNSSSGPP